MCQDKNKRKGLDLSDNEAHLEDHKVWSRRNFLQTIGMAGATSFSMNFLPVTGLFGFPLASALNEEFSDRKLVLIRLKGGNDGLNTIVPLYNYDTYLNVRPNLAHATNELINLTDDFAIPTAMNPLKNVWDEGKMRIINSVGYPDHNLSHFTGADIMASGNNNVDENGDGWLARYFVNQNPDYIENPPSDPPAIKIGGPTSILFNDEDKVDISANFASADKLSDLVETGAVYNNTEAPDECYYGQQVVFLRTIANAASIYSTAIFDAYNNSQTAANYDTSLGEQLKLVARMIKGGLKTQFYLVTLDGFDTHVGQNGAANHMGLLENLSKAVKAFYEDLADGNKDQEVLSMTYSEFGRRVEENGFNGTDHGTALPIMMFGPALEGPGTHGKNPDLDDLDEFGNLKFGTDFRSIYATILENWLCIASSQVDSILGASYERLSDIGISCLTTSTATVPIRKEFQHSILPRSGGQYQINFELTQAANVQVELITLSGKRIKTITNSYFHQGTHSLPFSVQELNVQLVPMVYIIKANGKQFVGKFIASSY